MPTTKKKLPHTPARRKPERSTPIASSHGAMRDVVSGFYDARSSLLVRCSVTGDEGAFDDVWSRVAPIDPDQRLSLMLALALRSAVEAREQRQSVPAGLARLIWALLSGHMKGALDWIDGKGSAAAAADRFLKQQGVESLDYNMFPPSSPVTWLLERALRNPNLREQPGAAFGRRQLPVNAEKMVAAVTVDLRFLHHAELVLGQPEGGWAATCSRMIRQVRAVAARSEPTQRTPAHYLAAILRGWGLSKTRVRDALRRLKS